MRIYLGGVIQGSRIDDNFDNQDYRSELKGYLLERFPNANIYCPFDIGQQLKPKTDEQIYKVFKEYLAQISTSDLFVGYFPIASNGTAIELYQSWLNNVPSVVITPMTENWALKCFSNFMTKDLIEFRQFLHNFKI